MKNVDKNDPATPESGVNEGAAGGKSNAESEKTIPSAHRSMRSKGPDVFMLNQDAQHVRTVEDVWEEESIAGESEGRTGEKSFIKIAIGVGCLLLVFLLMGGYLLLQSKPVVIEENHGDPSVKLPDPEMSYEVMIERMNEAVRLYFEADTVEKKLKCVRQPERVRPLMEEYYKQHTLKPLPFKKMLAQHPQTLEFRAFWAVKPDSGVEGVKLPVILVEQTDEGQFLVDWETEVEYQPADWGKFIESRSTAPAQFRVEVVPSGMRHAFYGFEFDDYKKYRAYQIKQREGDASLWAYAVKGSAADVLLINLLRKKPNASGLRVILTLRFPENAMSGRCVHIQSLDSSSWLFTESLPMSGLESLN